MINSSRPFSPELREGLHVALEHRLERLGRRPFGMIWSFCLHPVERKSQLDIHRMLDPKRTVIVEHSDAFQLRHEVDRALLGDLLDELDDRRLWRGVVPGGQGVGLGERCWNGEEESGRGQYGATRELADFILGEHVEPHFAVLGVSRRYSLGMWRPQFARGGRRRIRLRSKMVPLTRRGCARQLFPGASSLSVERD